MRRALIFAMFTAILAGGTCFAQTRKASKDSKPAARQELAPAPVAPANAPAVPAHSSPYNFPGVQYPRIEADSRVTFHFNAPTAQKVQVSIVNVPFDMVKGADGVWTYTSAPQAPGYHNYWSFNSMQRCCRQHLFNTTWHDRVQLDRFWRNDHVGRWNQLHYSDMDIPGFTTGVGKLYRCQWMYCTCTGYL